LLPSVDYYRKLPKNGRWEIKRTIKRPEGEGDSLIKKTGVLIGNFEKNTKEVPRSCFVGVA